jgi:hypothetical protein
LVSASHGSLKDRVSKRSPILGYNHNVRYRGLVFHVQTEDSGVASPHLFTHLFHKGVIVSTRKLVYDAGSAEESIKSLMQAQHKAVLKDLRRGHYDDKIDSYLGGTPGLLARGAEDVPARPSEIELPPSAGTVEDIASGAPTEQVLPLVLDELSAPVMILEATTPPPVPPARSIPEPPSTARARPALPFAGGRPPPPVDTTLKTEAPAFELDELDADSGPEIEIQLEVDDSDEVLPVPRRATRDTVAEPPSAELDGQTRPTAGVVSEEARRAATISDGIPSPIRPSSPAIPPPPDSRRLGERSTINAATLPPARPIARPAARPALSAPQVVSRPVASDDRSRRDSEAVEVYSPALPSAELPPGERPGTYAQHKRASQRIPIEPSRGPDTVRVEPSRTDTVRVEPARVDAARVEAARVEASRADARVEAVKNERSGGVAVPAGLGPPRRPGTSPTSAKPAATLPPSGSAPTSIPREGPRSANLTEPFRSRAPTPQRTGTPSSGVMRSGPHAGSGVVMSRPAVIVGAPTKNTGTIPRIRKAREDEGRGFGQGLISEKSLDEVILAYLSEDADEK